MIQGHWRKPIIYVDMLCQFERQVAMKTLRYETGFHKKPLWLWPINVNMRLLKAVDFVVDVVYVVAVVIVVVL